MEKRLQEQGIRKVGDLAARDERWLEQNFGALGLALSGKARGLDAGAWFDSDIGEDVGPRSISHEHTYSHDTDDRQTLEATLARLTEMVCRRLREQNLHARTLQLKLRYSDFRTLTRARTLEQPSSVDSEVLATIRELFRANWNGEAVRLLGVHASHFERRASSSACWATSAHEKWNQALSAADRLRERFGEGAVSLASGMKARFRERTHENPAGLPGKKREFVASPFAPANIARGRRSQTDVTVPPNLMLRRCGHVPGYSGKNPEHPGRGLLRAARG